MGVTERNFSYLRAKCSEKAAFLLSAEHIWQAQEKSTYTFIIPSLFMPTECIINKINPNKPPHCP